MQRAEYELQRGGIGGIDRHPVAVGRELDLRRGASQVIVEDGGRAELDERLAVGVARGIRVADLEVRSPVVRRPVDCVEIDIASRGSGESIDRVVDDSEVLGTVVQGRDPTGNHGAVLNRGIAERSAITERPGNPGQIVLVHIVRIELGQQTRHIDEHLVGRLELQADIAALADAVLLEQRRADERWDEGRITRAHRLIPQHLYAVAAQVSLLIDRGE